MIESKENVDVGLFEERMTSLAEKHQISEIVLNDIKMEVRRLKRRH